MLQIYRLITFLMGWFPYVEDLADGADLPVDIVKIALGLTAVVLISPLYRLFPSRIIRHTLSILFGGSFLFFMLQEIAFFVLGAMVIPYFLMRVLPNPFMVSVLCSVVMLLIVHSYRFIVSYVVWSVDCSVYVMVLVTKITYYAKWVCFWDYMGYNLFLPGLLAGPTFNYKLFLQYIYEPKQRPLNFLSAITPLLIGLPICAVTVICLPTFTSSWPLQSSFYLGLPFWQKVLLLNPIGFIYRSKYYTGWYVSQAAVNLSGISQSDSGLYDRIMAVSIMFQLEPNPKMKTEYWNSSFQVWLKDVVYAQLSTKMSSNLALFGTFIVSAFWHGLYLVYYLIFFLWAILIHVTKWSYKWSLVLPKSIRNSPLTTFLTWLTAFCLFNPIGMAGAILHWGNAIQFLKDLYYYPVIILGILLVLSLVVRPPKSKQAQAQKEA